MKTQITSTTEINDSIIGQWFHSRIRINYKQHIYSSVDAYIGQAQGVVSNYDAKRVYLVTNRGYIISITHLAFIKFNDSSKIMPQVFTEIQQHIRSNPKNSEFMIKEFLATCQKQISENTVNRLKIQSRLNN